MSLREYIKGSQTLSASVRRPPYYYKRLAKNISDYRAASVAEKRAKTEYFLEDSLQRAKKTAYGRSVGSPSSIQDWPICDKQTLRARGVEMKTAGIRPFIKSFTGGTTGVPVQVDLSLHAVALEQALLDHLVEPFSVDWFTSKVAVLRGDSIDHSDSMNGVRSQLTLGGKRLHFYSNSLSVDSIAAYVAKLEEFEPDILWVYPNVLRHFLRLLGSRRHKIRPKLVFSSSEVFDESLAKEISEKLHCDSIVDFYGQAERACAAFMVPGEGYYFEGSYGFVELIFERREEDADLYRIVATPYWNKSFGLVRLETGDFARIPRETSCDELHEIALGLRPFLGIRGRTDDYLVSPDGVLLVGIDHIHKGKKFVSQLQVVQRAIDRIELLVIPREEFTEDHAAELMHQARKKIPNTMEITISTSKPIQRTQSGKAPFVIRAFEVEAPQNTDD